MIFLKLCFISLIVALSGILTKTVISDRRKDYYTDYKEDYGVEAYNVADKVITVAFLVFVVSIILGVLFARVPGCGS